MKLLVRAILASCVIFNGLAFTDQTEITVSITLTGPVDELIPLLEQLKNMGIGEGLHTSAAEGLEVRIHSVATQEDPKTETEKPKPITAFTGAAVKPQRVAAGKKVLITAHVNDAGRKIDTVVATLTGGKVSHFDLFDNGTRGDAQAGDGIWSVLWPVHPSETGGQHSVVFHAYDANGDRLSLAKRDGKTTPMTYRTTFVVVR